MTVALIIELVLKKGIHTDEPKTVAPLTNVESRQKKGIKGIIGNEDSVREGVVGSNKTDSCHEGLGAEDARNHEGDGDMKSMGCQ